MLTSTSEDHIIIEVVASHIFMEWDTASKHGLCLFPIFFDQHGKIDVCEEARDQSGREKAVKQTAVEDKVPTQSQKGEREEVSERFPDNKPSQGKEEEVYCNQPMKKDLTWMVFAQTGIRV